MVQPNASPPEPPVTREVSDAWTLYLQTTKGLSRDRYDEVEPRAWRRLKLKLRER